MELPRHLGAELQRWSKHQLPPRRSGRCPRLTWTRRLVHMRHSPWIRDCLARIPLSARTQGHVPHFPSNTPRSAPRRSVPPRRLRRCALLLSRTLRMPRPCAGWPRCSCGNWGTSRPARPPCARRRGSCVRSGRVAAALGLGAASGLKVRPASWALHRSQRRAHRHRASAAPCTCDAREAEQGDGTWSRNGGKVQVADSGIHVWRRC